MGALGVLGLTDAEELAYEQLVDRPSASLAELAEAMDLPTRKLQPVVDELVRRGLVARVAGRPARYIVSPPEPAVEALARGAEEALARARVHAALLARRARAAESSSPADLVEVVEGAEAIETRVAQLQLGAKSEVRFFDLPPYLSDGENPVEEARLADGVTYRVVYDRALLDDPRHVDRITRCVNLGERARTLAGLPLKLMIIDHDVAVLPLGRFPEAVALIRPSVLLDSMVAMFETLWNRSVPLRAGFDPADVGDVDRDVIQIVGLLASGMKDETIARQLGVNVRTVRRRIRAALDALGVETRFQAGARAAELGLLEQD
ncbi:MAG: helix-turn-helix domain-containing protein [Acidimicrobiales bacterium]